MNSQLLHFDMVRGMDTIKILGGVSINHSDEAIFNRTRPIRIEEPYSSTKFNEPIRVWTESWKWSCDHPPNELVNRMPEYSVLAQIWRDYRCELWTCLDNRWLLLYPEEKLPPPTKGLILLIAVLQQNKSNVHPMLDFHKLNENIDPYPTHADICVYKLREKRKKIPICLCVTFEKLTCKFVCISPCDHTRLLSSRRYCLIHMGFGLNVTPSIMWTIMDVALLKDDTIWQATSVSIGNVFIDETIVSSSRMGVTSGQLWTGGQGIRTAAEWCAHTWLESLRECNMLK